MKPLGNDCRYLAIASNIIEFLLFCPSWKYGLKFLNPNVPSASIKPNNQKGFMIILGINL